MTEIIDVSSIRNIVLKYVCGKVTFNIASGSNAGKAALVILFLSMHITQEVMCSPTSVLNRFITK